MVSLRKEITKKLFTKADTSVDKKLSCPCINRSNLQTFRMHGVETAVLVSPCATTTPQKRRRSRY